MRFSHVALLESRFGDRTTRSVLCTDVCMTPTLRLVKEAKRMSQENVDLRKHMSSEQERWRAAERSRAKQDERRRIELDQKCDDLHALRYRWIAMKDIFVASVISSTRECCEVLFLSCSRRRPAIAVYQKLSSRPHSNRRGHSHSPLPRPNAVRRNCAMWLCGVVRYLWDRVQELEARLSRETARRHGAEEDARRSQEMERRRYTLTPTITHGCALPNGKHQKRL